MNATQKSVIPDMQFACSSAPAPLEQVQTEQYIRVINEEKSYLQLIITLMNSICAKPGLETVIRTTLQGMLNVIGGTNLKLVYQQDTRLYYADLYGEQKQIDQLDDILMSIAFSTGMPQEEIHDFSASLMTTAEFGNACSWAYPLQIGSRVIGVLKIENLHISMAAMSPHLPPLFRYIAATLNNEIFEESRLKKMLDKLEHEVNKRRQSELELRLIKDTLEERIKERTDTLLKMEQQFRKSQQKPHSISTKPDSEQLPASFDRIELTDVIDVEALQEMMNDYHTLTGIGVGIIDLNGNVLVGTGWQDICVKFHRAVPESCAFCHESDTILSRGVEPGTFKEYRCKNNMWDIATPIMLGDRHIGNIFLGQFFYDDEEPDYDVYRNQAARFGYDLTSYLDALDSVPRYSRQTIQTAMNFYAKLARTLSKSNFTVVQLQETVRKKTEYQKELEQINMELERFNYTVSHDLKGPLITIKGFAGSLEHDLEVSRYDRMTRDLKRISVAADAMDHLLNDLLVLSRIGKSMNAPVPIDMNMLVSAVLTNLAGSITAAEAVVSVHPGLPAISGDPVRIREVVQNLVENSITYRDRRRRLTIEIGSRHDTGMVVYYIADNGIGIDQKYHETVFGLFNQLDAKSNGTGIGLALVKRIIELHGGEVWLESAGVGHGSTFCFTVAHEVRQNAERFRE